MGCQFLDLTFTNSRTVSIQPTAVAVRGLGTRSPMRDILFNIAVLIFLITNLTVHQWVDLQCSLRCRQLFGGVCVEGITRHAHEKN